MTDIPEKQIKRLADLFKDQLDSNVYQALINYQVEITDQEMAMTKHDAINQERRDEEQSQ